MKNIWITLNLIPQFQLHSLKLGTCAFRLPNLSPLLFFFFFFNEQSKITVYDYVVRKSYKDIHCNRRSIIINKCISLLNMHTAHGVTVKVNTHHLFYQPLPPGVGPIMRWYNDKSLTLANLKSIFLKIYLELRSFISTIETTLRCQSAQYNNLWINIYCACVRLIYVRNELYFKFFSFILLRAWCIDYHVHKKQCLRARCTEKIPFVHMVSFTCPLVLNVRQVNILSVFIIHTASSPPIWFVQ